MVLVLADRRLAGRKPPPALRPVLDVVTTNLMTIYLWHIPVIAALACLALLSPALLLPHDPGTWWLFRPAWIAVAGVVLLVVVQVVTRWDVFCARYEPRATTPASILGALLAAVSLYVIWSQRLTTTMASALAILGIFVAGGLLSTTKAVQPNATTAPPR